MHLKWVILTYHDADGMRTVEVSGPPFVPVDRKSVSDTVFPLFFLPFFPENNKTWKINQLLLWYHLIFINHLVQLNSIIGLSFGNKTIYRITALHYTNDTNT